MRGSPFPTGKALALAVAFAAVHYVLSHVLLFAALGGLIMPAMIGFRILTFPLFAAIPDSSWPNEFAWLINSLAYGFVIAWALCFARWARRSKGASLWDAGLGTALVTFAGLALQLGEIGQVTSGPDAVRSRELAARRAEVAEANTENIRKGVAYYERVAADESKTTYIRELHANNAREEAAKAAKEEARADSFRAEAAYYARLETRPATRYPALILLALGVALGWIARRRRRRSEATLADDAV